jgi:hypothetical protein
MDSLRTYSSVEGTSIPFANALLEDLPLVLPMVAFNNAVALLRALRHRADFFDS